MFNKIGKLSQSLFNDKDEIMSDDALVGMSKSEKKKLKEELEKDFNTSIKNKLVTTKSITVRLYQEKLINKLSK
jgi:hypothetical protein